MTEILKINSQEDLKKEWYYFVLLEKKLLIHIVRVCKNKNNFVPTTLENLGKRINASPVYISTLITKLTRRNLLFIKRGRQKPSIYSVPEWLLEISFAGFNKIYPKNPQYVGKLNPKKIYSRPLNLKKI